MVPASGGNFDSEGVCNIKPMTLPVACHASSTTTAPTTWRMAQRVWSSSIDLSYRDLYSPYRVNSCIYILALPSLRCMTKYLPWTIKPLSRLSRPTSWRPAQTTSSHTGRTTSTEHATDYFVRFGDPDDLWPELQTQSYIFDYNPHPDAPRIPKVLHHFGDSKTMYLVMEFITLTAGAPIDRTALALVWLSSVPGRNASPLSPSLWACRLNPIPRWPYPPCFCGWWRIRNSTWTSTAILR